MLGYCYHVVHGAHQVMVCKDLPVKCSECPHSSLKWQRSHVRIPVHYVMQIN